MFTKLYSQITASSVWMENDQTRIVWVTMLAMCDQDGKVAASVPGLAHFARVPIDATRKALETFLSPDPDSATPDNEGRRIEKVDGGWKLLNYDKYRAAKEPAYQANRHAVNQANYRSRQKEPQPINEPRPEPRLIEDKEGLTPSMAATALLQELGGGSTQFLVTLTDIAKGLMSEGMSAEQAKKKMLARHIEYKAALDSGKLSWNYSSPHKFFAGFWDNPSAWGWKGGNDGVGKVSSTRTGNTINALREAAKQRGWDTSTDPA